MEQQTRRFMYSDICCGFGVKDNFPVNKQGIWCISNYIRWWANSLTSVTPAPPPSPRLRPFQREWKFINNTHRENCVLINSVQEFIEIEPWLLLTFILWLRNQLICIYILLSNIKEYRCLKNVVHEIDRNEWLLLSAFQQGLRQNQSWFLS